MTLPPGDVPGRLAALIAASPHNLVSRRDRDQVLERHVGESLAVAAAVRPTGRWMDLGTGGGLPGLLMAWRHPDVSWTLVDATAKKVAAVAAFAAELGLDNVITVAARAEQLAHDPSHRARYQGVVSRAVARLATLAELTRGFLAPGGVLVAVKGPAWRAELDDALPALQRLRLLLDSTMSLHLPDREVWLVTMKADGPPPPDFPRRDGLPQQDPLH